MKRPIALLTKLFVPDMVHVTTVWPPSGLKVNSAMFVPLKGLRKSSRNRTNWPGWLSVMVMLPAPTLLLPSQAKLAPTPSGGPE